MKHRLDSFPLRSKIAESVPGDGVLLALASVGLVLGALVFMIGVVGIATVDEYPGATSEGVKLIGSLSTEPAQVATPVPCGVLVGAGGSGTVCSTVIGSATHVTTVPGISIGFGFSGAKLRALKEAIPYEAFIDDESAAAFKAWVHGLDDAELRAAYLSEIASIERQRNAEREEADATARAAGSVPRAVCGKASGRWECRTVK